MFERFTDAARKALVRAQEESRALNHSAIGTEHFAIALSNCVETSGQVFMALGIAVDDVRNELEKVFPPREAPLSGHIPFTSGAKATLENSQRHSVTGSAGYIGTGHLLLGLLDEEERSGGILTNLGVDLNAMQEKARELLVDDTERPAPSRPGISPFVRGRIGSEISEPFCPGCGNKLEGNLAATKLAFAEESGPREATLLYCRTCGTALGTLG